MAAAESARETIKSIQHIRGRGDGSWIVQSSSRASMTCIYCQKPGYIRTNCSVHQYFTRRSWGDGDGFGSRKGVGGGHSAECRSCSTSLEIIVECDEKYVGEKKGVTVHHLKNMSTFFCPSAGKLKDSTVLLIRVNLRLKLLPLERSRPFRQ